jgi:hypothetical protein
MVVTCFPNLVTSLLSSVSWANAAHQLWPERSGGQQ